MTRTARSTPPSAQSCTLARSRTSLAMPALIGGLALAQGITSYPLAAQQTRPADSAGFVTRLGEDTVAVERTISRPDSFIGEMLDRYPRTERVTYGARLTPDHQVASYTIVFYSAPTPGAAASVSMHAELHGDSAYLTTTRGTGSEKKTVAIPPGSVPMNEPSWAILQIVADRALAAHGRPVDYTAAYLPSLLLRGHAFASANRDTVHIETKDDHVRAVVDQHGRILSITNPGGTVQDVVVRTPWFDLKPWVANFVARDAQGKSLGTLSPRGTAKATIGGAALAVDYGQPTRRGRQIFGAVVPWNVIWRTGANEATAFSVSKDITLNGTRIPAGNYTLFSVPAPDRWTLVVSRRTGEWGTEYDSTADLVRIPMRVSTSVSPLERFTVSIEPHGADGVITFAWDTRVGTLTVERAPSS
jgi:hypothetical protein